MMHHRVREYLQQRVSDFAPGVDVDVVLEYPRDRAFGHFATPVCFRLASFLKKSPASVAMDFCRFLSESDDISHGKCDRNDVPGSSHMFSAIEHVNGFLNFKLSIPYLESMLDDALSNPGGFARGSEKNCTVLVEYVSANPTGPLHIGHARGAVFGNVLQRVGRHLGYDVCSEYYVNDTGAQIDMLASSMYNVLADDLGLEGLDCDVYKGDYIREVSSAYLDLHGVDGIRSIVSTGGLNALLESMGEFGKDAMLDEIKGDLSEARVVIDNFVSEKNVYIDYEDMLAQLDSAGALREVDRALWLRSSLKGDTKDRVLVRASGVPTYLMGDLLYHKDKFSRNYDRYVNIWGADHHGYIQRIRAGLDYLGFDSSRLEVLLSQMVSLLKSGTPYKMSKRAGNFISMSDVISEIGSDNLRFIFLSKSLSTHLEFDLDSLMQEDISNPVFYINYANARIQTLISKSCNTSYMLSNLRDLDVADVDFKNDCINLIFHSLSLHYVLSQSYEYRELHKICEYLKDLAKCVHVFYANHRIIGSSFESHILKILSLASLSLRVGFDLLGIEIKTSM